MQIPCTHVRVFFRFRSLDYARLRTQNSPPAFIRRRVLDLNSDFAKMPPPYASRRAWLSVDLKLGRHVVPTELASVSTQQT